MKFRFALPLLVVLLALPACGPASPDYGCAETVKDILASQAKGDFGIPMTIAERLRSLSIVSIEPVVTLTAETVTVQVTTFTLWGGFYRQTYTIQRSFPHTILDKQEEQLVPYDCGIMF